MRVAKRITILMILVLLTIGRGQSGEESVKSISNTRTANCLVKITCDPAVLPPDALTMSYLFHSSAVAGKAAREVLDVPADEIQDHVQIQLEAVPLSDSATLQPSSKMQMTPSGSDIEEYGYEMMMEMDQMGSAAPTTARRPGETTPQYEARRRAEAAARARALAATRSRTDTTIPRRASPQSSISAVDRTMLLRLQVDLDESIKPAAKEFMSALVENLRDALLKSHAAYVDELHSRLQLAEHGRDKIEARLVETTSQIGQVKVTPPIRLDPAEAAVREQLETIVDLSNLSQAMPFEEVITQLKNAVDPPLQIQPNWKDLRGFGDIQPTTPALMDPLTGIRLRKALELLLAGLSSDLAELGYVVDEGVIVISTTEALPKKMVTHVYEIPALAYSPTSARGLEQTIQESIEPDSWFDLSTTGEGTINVAMGNKLAIYQTLDIHQKIHEFLQSVTTDMRASTPSQIPPEMLISERRDLLREKRSIDMEVARLQARQLAIEMQIVQMSHDLVTKVQPPDPVISQLEQLIEMHTEQLALMEKQAEAGRLAGNELGDVKEKLTRARIDLAKRRQEVSLPAGGARAEKYNDELADLTIELAEKTAALQILDKQLSQTEQQLTVATMIDPQASRIRAATRAFEIADQRVNELNAHLANLRPPTVSIIGGD